MTTVEDIFKFLDSIAPVNLAEDYDNPGLLAGEPNREVFKAILSLDITPETAEETSNAGAQLVISHHPVIFKPLRSLISTGVSAAVWKLASLSLSAICMHTNLDLANGGVNDALSAAIGLKSVSHLQEYRKINYKKIAVFVPQDYADNVRFAMTSAGAGKFKCYDGCAFTVNGKGFFRPLEGAKPFIGNYLNCESVDEVRVEVICAPKDVNAVVAAMIAVHPYELPAYDIFDDESVAEEYSMGRIGLLNKKTALADYAGIVKDALSSSCVKVLDCGKEACKIAVCGGAADGEIITAAAKSGADTLVTGEMKHSLYYTALEAGINIVEAGHFATEAVILPVLKSKLSAAFPTVGFEIAKSCREPYYAV